MYVICTVNYMTYLSYISPSLHLPLYFLLFVLVSFVGQFSNFDLVQLPFYYLHFNFYYIINDLIINFIFIFIY